MKKKPIDHVSDRRDIAWGGTEAVSESVSASDVAKSLGALLDKVRGERVSIVIERHGTPIARLSPIVEPRRCTPQRFVDLIATLPPAAEDFREAVRRGVAEMNQPVSLDTPWES
jgi:antitoxin (DNA-binding transcriptional repressor) of toxin-antitoxin stability system